MLYKHNDLLHFPAVNKDAAKNKARDFLEHYGKQKIFVGPVQGCNGIYEVIVQYFDKYEHCAVFPSTDFLPDEKPEEPKELVFKM